MPAGHDDEAFGPDAQAPTPQDIVASWKRVAQVEAAAAPAKPITQPITANFAPASRIRLMIPARCDPSAMRIAISCTREATENAITL